MLFEPSECHARAQRKDQKDDERNDIPRDAPPQAVVDRIPVVHGAGAQGTMS